MLFLLIIVDPLHCAIAHAQCGPWPAPPSYDCKMRQVKYNNNSNFLVIASPPKSGTTELFYKLIAQPGFAGTTCKETRYFDADELFTDACFPAQDTINTHRASRQKPTAGSAWHYPRHASDWLAWTAYDQALRDSNAYAPYQALFRAERANSACFAIDVSPSYFIHAAVPYRLAHFAMRFTLKILFTLRDPIARLESRLAGNLRRGNQPQTCNDALQAHNVLRKKCQQYQTLKAKCSLTILDLCVHSFALNDPIALGAYFHFLEALWAPRFDISGKDKQLLILPAELLAGKQQNAALRRIASWLGLAPWTSIDSQPPMNSTPASEEREERALCDSQHREQLLRFYHPYNTRIRNLLQPYHLPALKEWSLPGWLLLDSHEERMSRRHIYTTPQQEPFSHSAILRSKTNTSTSRNVFSLPPRNRSKASSIMKSKRTQYIATLRPGPPRKKQHYSQLN